MIDYNENECSLMIFLDLDRNLFSGLLKKTHERVTVGGKESEALLCRNYLTIGAVQTYHSSFPDCQKWFFSSLLEEDLLNGINYWLAIQFFNGSHASD
jgi:hypothetical protein